MNKNIINAVLAIAIVFCFASMPMYGIVKGDEQEGDAIGVIRNVAPQEEAAMATEDDDRVVFDSGTDTLNFTAAVLDRNREDDIGDVGETPAGCWWNISKVDANYVNYTLNVSSTGLQSGEANLLNVTADDGILELSDDTADPWFIWTCPDDWVVGDYWANMTITDKDGNELVFAAFKFEVKCAAKIIGIYNYTGLLVDSDTPYYWNFTTTDPGVLNATSGNWSYTGTDDPATNYGYDNDTGRLYSFWIIVNNSAEDADLCFNVSFADEFTSELKPGTTIATKNVIRFEYYRTSNLTYEGDTTAGTNSSAEWVTDNEHSNLTYVKDGDADDVTADDGMYMFQFDGASQNIWIRFMIDIPIPCRSSDDYKCTYTVKAG